MKKIICSALATIGIATTFSGCGTLATIDFAECVDVEFTGYNDEGSAYIQTDTGYIFSLLGDMNSYSAASLVSTFYVENEDADDNGKLSNGDEITLTVITDPEVLKNAKVKVTNTELHFTVEGLEEKPKIDIFSDVSLEVTGISPYCSVSVEYNGEHSLNSFSFDVAASDGSDKKQFANGDKVTVTLTESEKKSLERDGILKETSKEFTIKSDGKYIYTADDLPADRIEYLTTSINDTVTAKIPEITSSTDNSSKVNIISSLSGLSAGTLYASTCYVKNIENVTLNSAYIGTAQEAVGFSGTRDVPYIYYIYDADISYCVNDFFNAIDTTVQGQLIVGISEPVLYDDGQIIYQKLIITAAPDFQTACNWYINDTFSSLS